MKRLQHFRLLRARAYIKIGKLGVGWSKFWNNRAQHLVNIVKEWNKL